MRVNMIKNLRDRTVALKDRANVRILQSGALSLLFAANYAHADGIGAITNAANLVMGTVVGICAAVMTSAWGVAGYRMAYQGVSFRDVSSNIVGGAVAGSAGAIAATFMAA